MNIIELNELIDLLNRFFHDTAHRMLMIGGIVGSHPLSHVLDVATGYTEFNNILTLEGCADFCYLPKRFVSTYLPFSYVFYEMYVSSLQPDTLFPFQFYQHNIPCVKMINRGFYQKFPIVIINNAHLIEMEYIKQLVETCNWKCILIGDPFDLGGEEFMYAPCIVESLEKQSPIVGMARKLWGFSTHAIDKRVPGHVSSGKVTRKGIGKLDGRMYLCDNPELINQAQSQQMKQSLRKGQRFLVTDDRLYTTIDDTKQTHIITKNMMLVMQRANSLSPIPQQFRLYHSKQIIRLDIEYETAKHYFNERDYHVKVKPANVLSIQDARYHRYLNTVLACTGEVPKRELYSVMKNSVNLAICHVKGM